MVNPCVSHPDSGPGPILFLLCPHLQMFPHSSRVRPQRPSSSEHRQLSVHASPYRRRERLGAPTRWSSASRPAELLQVLGTIPRLVRVLCAPSLAHAPLCMLPVDTTAPTLPNAEPIPESSSPASIPLHTLALALSYVGRLSRYHCMVRGISLPSALFI
ncbi:hypothetical protein FB451DRAFT_122212 [Mycena latifolia]|nr:hypothetical protein FB451DRAFT_122212 [Mycena latifolia]